MDQLQSTDKKSTRSVNSLILLLALNVGGVSRYWKTPFWGFFECIPPFRAVTLIYQTMIVYQEKISSIMNWQNMFGKLPPSNRNHGNKQYPIAKTRKHNRAQNHIFIYLNN